MHFLRHLLITTLVFGASNCTPSFADNAAVTFADSGAGTSSEFSQQADAPQPTVSKKDGIQLAQIVEPKTTESHLDATNAPAKVVAVSSTETGRVMRVIEGWNVSIDRKLYELENSKIEFCLEALEKQLKEIVRILPRSISDKLKKVDLYVNDTYPGTSPKAEYHPSGQWLKENGRDPRMAKSVEFTNVGIFEKEIDRMPFFVLHELAHAFHDQFLENGFGNKDIEQQFQRAKASGKYDRVERRLGGKAPNLFEPSYALTSPMEFFAEATEAYFGVNDFFPFNRQELEEFDPQAAELVSRMWKMESTDKSTTPHGTPSSDSPPSPKD